MQILPHAHLHEHHHSAEDADRSHTWLVIAVKSKSSTPQVSPFMTLSGGVWRRLTRFSAHLLLVWPFAAYRFPPAAAFPATAFVASSSSSCTT